MTQTEVVEKSTDLADPEELRAILGDNWQECTDGRPVKAIALQRLKDLMRGIKLLYMRGMYEVTVARLVGLLRGIPGASIRRGTHVTEVVATFPCLFNTTRFTGGKLTLTDKGKDVLSMITEGVVEIKPLRLIIKKKKDDISSCLFRIESILRLEEGYTEIRTLDVRTTIVILDEEEIPIDVEEYLSGNVKKIRVEGEIRCIWKQCPHEIINFSMPKLKLTEKHQHIRTLIEFLVENIEEIERCLNEGGGISRRCRRYQNLNPLTFDDIKKVLLAVGQRATELFGEDEVELKIVQDPTTKEKAPVVSFKKLNKNLCLRCITTNCEHTRLLSK